jgi:hypothetical protein
MTSDSILLFGELSVSWNRKLRDATHLIFIAFPWPQVFSCWFRYLKQWFYQWCTVGVDPMSLPSVSCRPNLENMVSVRRVQNQGTATGQVGNNISDHIKFKVAAGQLHPNAPHIIAANLTLFCNWKHISWKNFEVHISSGSSSTVTCRSEVHGSNERSLQRGSSVRRTSVGLK